jgi:hypothetical protein
MILSQMAQHQSESMTAIKTQFDGLMAHMLSSFPAGNVAPSPPARRSHLSTIEYTTTDSQVGESLVATSPTQALTNHDPNAASQSMRSIASDSSGGSSTVRPPRTKRSRSIQNDMEQLSLQSDPNSDSELSTLGHIAHDSEVFNDLSRSPDAPDTSMHAPNFHSEVATTDSNAQYQFQRDSNGGAHQ